MAKLILDVMGGDHAPLATLEGASKALSELTILGGQLVLVGDELVLRPLLNKRRFRALSQAITSGRVELVHSSQSIEMDDSIRAIRSKPEASINIGCQLAAQSYAALAQQPGSPAAFISAGHSGAIMASALMQMGRLPHVERPAIAVKLPSLSPDGCILLDVGANVDCKPEHLRDFAIMGALFAQVGRKKEGLPKVGVLSNGEERGKGTELTRLARDLIEKHPAFQAATLKTEPVGTFVGYSEGKEIFKGDIDVVVADGFVGNLVLKSVEGLGLAIVSLLKKEFRSGLLTSLGFLLSAGAFKRLKRKLDYAETGAGPLLGVAGYAFICHGRSNSKAIKNALLHVHSAVQSRMIERLEKALKNANHLPEQPAIKVSE